MGQIQVDKLIPHLAAADHHTFHLRLHTWNSVEVAFRPIAASYSATVAAARSAQEAVERQQSEWAEAGPKSFFEADADRERCRTAADPSGSWVAFAASEVVLEHRRA